jgi:hypothetical protein
MPADLTGDVIELTNTVGSAAYDIQRATETVKRVRRGATLAARHPGAIAIVGATLLVVSAALALRQPSARPDSPQT